ncbi:M16 family metallopeptidase [Undibacterium terreum]|uniref:Peptidase M16 n=1 Tax=Undibacterium terreum TaxID=1224302 RepID=A0A916V0L7_9BURK|nr:pitrilysin family protein [Undibacterium terreum]GGC94690.1 peptidase M16 [Undibacterium terreum]
MQGSKRFHQCAGIASVHSSTQLQTGNGHTDTVAGLNSVFKIARASVLGVALLASGLAAAQTAPVLPKGVSQITTVEGITEYRLQNGLKILLMPDASKPTTTVNVTYLVGSRHENYGETGMAHLLEHMMFKGAPKHPKITEEFNKRGMRPNGTTSLDRTNYFEIFQAGDDNLKWAIGMEADRMVNSFIAKKDLDSEMTVVRNEYESGENSPFGVLLKRMQSVAYDWHNYGNSTIGNRSDIENVKIENLQAFYHTYYQPDNAVVMIAGKFDVAQTLKWISESFGVLPKPKRSLPVLWTVEPTQDGERSFVVRRKGDIQLVAVAYKMPAGLHPDNDSLSYAADILSDSPNGRLHKQFVESGKAVAIVNIPLGSYAPGLQIIGAVVKKGQPIEPVRDELISAIENFSKTAPTKEEMDRITRKNANATEKLLNDHEKIGVAMSEIIALGDWRYLFQNRDQQASITAEQVSAAAGKYFKRDNRTVGMFLPEDAPQRAEIPAAPSIEEVMKGYKGKASTGEAENFDPSPANIDKRTQRSKIGDINVAILSKHTKGEMVSVALNLHRGDEKSLVGKKWIAALTGSMIGKGTSKYSRAELADEMSKLKMSGGIYSFTTTKSNLAAALQLSAHILKDPSFPESEFTQAREQMIVNLEASRNEPNAVASRALGLYFNRYPKGDIRAAETIDESIAGIKAVTLDDVKAYYKQFYGASNAEMSIVGDVDAAEAGKQIAAAYGNWKSASPYTRLSSRYDDIPAKHETLNTPDKENGFYIAAMNLQLRDDDADYPALYVANYIFGASGLDSRLMLRIRQKDGLSYGGGSGIEAGSVDRVGSFSISAIAAPQNLAKVDAAVNEELARMLKDGFTEQELARAKSGLLQQRLQGRTSDPRLASGWNFNLEHQRTFAWSQALDDKIKALTVEQLNAAVRKTIDPSKLTVFIAGDQSKMKPEAAK